MAATIRPALGPLLTAVRAREIDCVMVYKVDRLSRSLLDFARITSLCDEHAVSFVSVTQQFNTSSSLGKTLRIPKYRRSPVCRVTRATALERRLTPGTPPHTPKLTELLLL